MLLLYWLPGDGVGTAGEAGLIQHNQIVSGSSLVHSNVGTMGSLFKGIMSHVISEYYLLDYKYKFSSQDLSMQFSSTYMNWRLVSFPTVSRSILVFLSLK